jgi:hypothetical protein
VISFEAAIRRYSSERGENAQKSANPSSNCDTWCQIGANKSRIFVHFVARPCAWAKMGHKATKPVFMGF